MPDLAHLGALHLNVWSRDPATASTALVLFDAADPTVVAGGYIAGIGAIAGGFLHDNGNTPEPGDYRLFLSTPIATCDVALLLAVQMDGTVDVRGSADYWCGYALGDFIIEGVGTMNFVVPGGQ
jgi:hypothetical protein